MSTIVNCWNEWDPLKRVILGSCRGSSLPFPDPSWDHTQLSIPNYHGPMPQEMQDAAEEQMDGFQRIMEKRGIIVDRPKEINTYQPSGTPDWTVPLQRGCQPPRDVFFPLGNEILECPMCLRTRYYEAFNFRDILQKYFHEDPNFQWSSAPRPRLRDEYFEAGYWQNFKWVWDDETKQKRMEACHYHMLEREPLFDAADGQRYGKDILFMRSAVTNECGWRWFAQYYTAKGFRVHKIALPDTNFQPWHVDGMLTPIKPGIVMVCPVAMPLPEKLQQFYKRNDWEMVECAPPTHYFDYRHGVLDEHQGPYWISANILALSPNTVAVEAHETAYCEQLDKMGFEVVPVPFEQAVPFGGSLHCSTVDVYREGTLQDYFPNQIPGF